MNEDEHCISSSVNEQIAVSKLPTSSLTKIPSSDYCISPENRVFSTTYYALGYSYLYIRLRYSQKLSGKINFYNNGFQKKVLTIIAFGVAK